MANEMPIHGLPKVAPAAAGPATKADATNGGVAFRALLDALESKARELQDRSEAVERPEDLAGAVQGAKATLDDALSIRDRLLEAYREARQQDSGQHDAERKRRAREA